MTHWKKNPRKININFEVLRPMIRFKQKNIITVKSLGEDLERARKRVNLSVLAVEKKIGVARHYLEAEKICWFFRVGLAGGGKKIL